MHRYGLIVNVEVAVVRDGRFLAIVRGAGEDHGAGWLGFPGGKVEPDPVAPDALEETARREVAEEVGLALDNPIVYIESHTFAVGDEIVLDVVMLARSTTGEPHIAAPEEVADVAWLACETFRDDDRTQRWTRDSLDLVNRQRRELGW